MVMRMRGVFMPDAFQPSVAAEYARGLRRACENSVLVEISGEMDYFMDYFDAWPTIGRDDMSVAALVLPCGATQGGSGWSGQGDEGAAVRA
jgi:hypothetical protein